MSFKYSIIDASFAGGTDKVLKVNDTLYGLSELPITLNGAATDNITLLDEFFTIILWEVDGAGDPLPAGSQRAWFSPTEGSNLPWTSFDPILPGFPEGSTLILWPTEAGIAVQPFEVSTADAGLTKVINVNTPVVAAVPTHAELGVLLNEGKYGSCVLATDNVIYGSGVIPLAEVAEWGIAHKKPVYNSENPFIAFPVVGSLSVTAGFELIEITDLGVVVNTFTDTVPLSLQNLPFVTSRDIFAASDVSVFNPNNTQGLDQTITYPDSPPVGPFFYTGRTEAAGNTFRVRFVGDTGLGGVSDVVVTEEVEAITIFSKSNVIDRIYTVPETTLADYGFTPYVWTYPEQNMNFGSYTPATFSEPTTFFNVVTIDALPGTYDYYNGEFNFTSFSDYRNNAWTARKTLDGLAMQYTTSGQVEFWTSGGNNNLPFNYTATVTIRDELNASSFPSSGYIGGFTEQKGADEWIVGVVYSRVLNNNNDNLSAHVHDGPIPPFGVTEPTTADGVRLLTNPGRQGYSTLSFGFDSGECLRAAILDTQSIPVTPQLPLNVPELGFPTWESLDGDQRWDRMRDARALVKVTPATLAVYGEAPPVVEDDLATTVDLEGPFPALQAIILRGVEATRVLNNFNVVVTHYLPFVLDKAAGLARQVPLDMNGHRVTDLAPAETNDDAITVAQLREML